MFAEKMIKEIRSYYKSPEQCKFNNLFRSIPGWVDFIKDHNGDLKDEDWSKIDVVIVDFLKCSDPENHCSLVFKSTVDGKYVHTEVLISDLVEFLESGCSEGTVE